MANGLTDSDMNRRRLGFGVSGDTESRRRAAAAGVAPLTTSERIRRDWGWGPDSSPESQRAFQAAEVMERGGPISEMPAEYGGRPQGSSRRAIRQQWEWDQMRKQQLAEEQAARQIEEFNGAMAIRDLEYQTKDLDLKLKRSNLAADLQNQKIINEQANIAIGIMGQYPDTPEGIAAATAEINKIAPRAWENETVGKNYYYKDKNSQAFVGSNEAQKNKAVEDAVSAALRAGLTEADIAKFKTLDQQGGETYDIGGLRRATDIVIGERVVAAEGRKEPEDTRTELQKAQDQLADSKARLGAFLDEGGDPVEESETYRRALADVKESESRVDRLSGAKPKPKKEEDKAPQYTPEQITAAKDIARDIKHPKNKQAIRFLRSINESY